MRRVAALVPLVASACLDIVPIRYDRGDLSVDADTTLIVTTRARDVHIAGPLRLTRDNDALRVHAGAEVQRFAYADIDGLALSRLDVPATATVATIAGAVAIAGGVFFITTLVNIGKL